MTERTLDLKNPWIAGVLAFLIPGAGHLYQGRTFKGTLYLVCILGTFLFGMSLGEWKVVAATQDISDLPGAPSPKQISMGYFAQVSAGAIALPAIVQSKRYFSPENKFEYQLAAPLKSEFQGVMFVTTEDNQNLSRTVTGTVTLTPATGLGYQGEFQGVDEQGEKHTLALDGVIKMGPKISAGDLRLLECDIWSPTENQQIGFLKGGIPRSFKDSFQVPLSPEVRTDVYGRLGRTYELALVFTWIAGFLNILAIWDAIEGPAYGWGDEQPPEDSQEKKEKKKAQAKSTPAATST